MHASVSLLLLRFSAYFVPFFFWLAAAEKRARPTSPPTSPSPSPTAPGALVWNPDQTQTGNHSWRFFFVRNQPDHYRLWRERMKTPTHVAIIKRKKELSLFVIPPPRYRPHLTSWPRLKEFCASIERATPACWTDRPPSCPSATSTQRQRTASATRLACVVAALL